MRSIDQSFDTLDYFGGMLAFRAAFWWVCVHFCAFFFFGAVQCVRQTKTTRCVLRTEKSCWRRQRNKTWATKEAHARVVL
jgi:hypothetical protein